LEIVKNEDFKRYLSKMLQHEPSSYPIDSVNLQDEKRVVILGPLVEDRDDSSPPFYTSLNIHDKVLDNYLMDSGAYHNLIPNTVMNELALEVTKTYHDLYSFDSRKVKCLGVIKDLVVSLFQLPMKRVVMDIVVVDVPSKFGMLLYRPWIKRIGGTCIWVFHMPPFLCLGGDIEGFIGKHNLLTLSVMNKILPTTLFLQLILI
jgi:hypothetical protein